MKPWFFRVFGLYFRHLISMATEVQRSLESVPLATPKELGEGCALTAFLIVDALWRKLPSPVRVLIVASCVALLNNAFRKRRHNSR